MKHTNAIAITALTLGAIFFTGCADPIDKLLKQNGRYGVVRPPSDGLYLGDVHIKKDLTAPSVSMRDVVSDSKERSEMMEARKTEITVPSLSGSSSFKISGSAKYIGVASGSLLTHGASKYKVNIGKAYVYDAPIDSYLKPVLLTGIRTAFSDVDLNKKYIVRSLLKVESLEYEFYNSSGTKIDLASDGTLSSTITGSLGGEWEVSRQGTLIIKEPKYIGFRVAQIVKDGGLHPLAPGAPAPSRQTIVKSVGVKIGTPPSRKAVERKHKHRQLP
jgi:hypothetical protein